MTDLIVAGAGPAGLATALYAARAGLATTVLDARAAPIDKACGEGLMPGAVEALRALDVELSGFPICGIRYLDGRTSAATPFRSGPAMGVRRTTLHAAMLDAARRAGVEIVAERASDVRTHADGVVVDGRRAAYLAVADGLHSPLRRRLGLARPPARRRQPRWGTRAHFGVTPWTDHVEVHWAARSEAYVTPVGPRLVGVAVLSGSQAPFAEQLRAFPALAARLPADAVTSVRGAGPLRQRTARRVAGRALLVGDAAGYVDALTGEGIAVSLACARALVECLAAGEPEAYERRWLAESRRYRLITSSLLWARRRPVLAGRIVPLAARFPGLFGLALRQLAT